METELELELKKFNNELVMLDDYKISIQSKLETIENTLNILKCKKPKEQNLKSLKSLYDFKHETINNVKNLRKKINSVHLDLESIQELNQTVISLKNKNYVDNIHIIRYIHATCIITFVACTSFNLFLNFYCF